jgi:hypothetical protein
VPAAETALIASPTSWQHPSPGLDMLRNCQRELAYFGLTEENVKFLYAPALKGGKKRLDVAARGNALAQIDNFPYPEDTLVIL